MAASAHAITLDQVFVLLESEVPDETIIKKIVKDASKFTLVPKDIMELKRRGASAKLIQYMLTTASAGSGKAGTTAAPPPEKKAERELSEAEKAAEEARLKEESLRILEEQKKREEAGRKMFAGKVLAAGQNYAVGGEFVKAIQTFTKFVDEGVDGVAFAPDSTEAYSAKYGIANALARAGLIQSAADTLLDVVKSGSDKLFFTQAFIQLRDLRRLIIYRPPELEELTKITVTAFDQAFQDAYYYLVGESLNDFGVKDQARPYLEKVSQKANEYARAQYLIGLMSIPDNPEEKLVGAQVKDASESFQKAVLAAENQAEGRPVVDLAYLALARLAYDIQQFDAAIYYYKKISKTSPKLATAFYESGWTYFLKGDVSRALGTFHALHSPYFSHQFYPELWVLEATAYVNLCHADRAEQAMKMFEEKVFVLGPPLRDFLKRSRKPEEYYNNFLAAVNKPKSGVGLPRQLQSPVLGNVEFYNLHQTVKQIDKEDKVIRANLAALGPVGDELLNKLGQRRTERVSEAGVVIQQTLRQAQKELDLYFDKLQQLRLDLDEIRTQEIEDEQAGKGKELGDGVAKEGSIAIAGSDSMSWPFEGEFWKDEIGAYRSFLRTKCKAENKLGQFKPKFLQLVSQK
ncbi:MAG: hypothetical protein EXR77_07915 [Myxococcales bacterium]|nr:hypothetical protein [Myxococcales bacterium]